MSSISPGGGADTRSIALADVNGDGTLDVFLGVQGGANQLLINDGTGTFTASATFPGGDNTFTTNTAAFGDVDGDGDPDLLTGNTAANILLINDGAGGEHPPRAIDTHRHPPTPTDTALTAR